MYSGKTTIILNLVHIMKNRDKFPKKLLEILTKPSWVKVGVGINMDMKILYDNYGLGFCNSVIDILCIAGMCQYKTPNLGNLYKVLCGSVEKSKSAVFDWSKQEIPLSKIKYAAKDAIMSRRVYFALLDSSVRKLKKLDEKTKITLKMIDMDDGGLNKEPLDEINWVSMLNEYSQRNGLTSSLSLSFVNVGTYYRCICIFGNKKTTSSVFENKKAAKKEAFRKMCEKINL